MQNAKVYEITNDKNKKAGALEPKGNAWRNTEMRQLLYFVEDGVDSDGGAHWREVKAKSCLSCDSVSPLRNLHFSILDV